MPRQTIGRCPNSDGRVSTRNSNIDPLYRPAGPQTNLISAADAERTYQVMPHIVQRSEILHARQLCMAQPVEPGPPGKFSPTRWMSPNLNIGSGSGANPVHQVREPDHDQFIQFRPAVDGCQPPNVISSSFLEAGRKLSTQVVLLVRGPTHSFCAKQRFWPFGRNSILYRKRGGYSSFVYRRVQC